jgi:serine protease Do
MEKEISETSKKNISRKEKQFFCSECGSVIENGNNYCENCGKKIDESHYSNDTEEFEEALAEEKSIDIPNTIEEGDNTFKDLKYSKKKKFKNHLSDAKKKINFDKLKNNKAIIAIISSIITLLVCMIFTITYCNYFVKTNSTAETVTKDVTITDTGIAESVSKVYDSVVVVETYVDGQLYATGTGFVYKTDDKYGYILTNNHVIEEGTEIKVVFTDKTEETVKVVGSDSYSDIALLAVSKDAVISVAETGSSKDIEVGDTTFAVGAPLDSAVYSWTVTRGILSGKNRLVEVSTSSSNYFASSSYLMEVLQTDTAINSGNSGGPLCNANGEVIGITNMKISSSSVEGMGFAIPIETATEYADKFINGETIVRPYLGISMYDMNSGMMGNTKGVYVAAVEKGSPAADAGLQKGDIITKIGDASVDSSSYLKYELYKYDIGDKVTFTYTRNNKESTTTITLSSTSASQKG